MFEPVSSTLGVVWLGYASVSAYARRGTAVSFEADALREAATVVVRPEQSSQALFGAKNRFLDRLFAMAEECGEEDWDGYGARPADAVALATAVEFVRVLPDTLPGPDLGVDPDGAISLDWTASRTRIFSVSIGKTDRLSCAWVDGTESGHFVVTFSGGLVPKRVMEEIRAVVGNAAPAATA
ncbi:MAG TPA: hypothetical protein PKX00_09385 [Opitutaceae bacterium]|nr:hypothetical protein [Opitutaceae bacterium]